MSQVHTIIDMSEVIHFQPGLQQIKDDAKPNQNLPEVGGWMVYVGVGKLVSLLIQIGARVAGKQVRIAQTLPEAVAFLVEVDPTLAEFILAQKT